MSKALALTSKKGFNEVRVRENVWVGSIASFNCILHIFVRTIKV